MNVQIRCFLEVLFGQGDLNARLNELESTELHFNIEHTLVDLRVWHLNEHRFFRELLTLAKLSQIRAALEAKAEPG